MTPEDRLLELTEAWEWPVIGSIARVVREARAMRNDHTRGFEDLYSALDELDSADRAATRVATPRDASTPNGTEQAE